MVLHEAIIHARETSSKPDICPECASEHRQLAEWLEELQQYKSIGLNPDEVVAMRHTLNEYHKEADPLLRAKVEGRLVVLPCGVNDTAWYADTDTNRVLMGYISSYQFLSDGAVYFEFTNIESDIEWVSVELPVDDFGKTVFLTHEEAERALKGENKDE